MNVTLLAYRNMVLVIPDEPVEDPTWDPVGHRGGRTRLGSTLLDTRTNLRASPEALDILRAIRMSQSPIGDWSWQHEGGQHVFTWFGPLYRIIVPETSIGARGSRVFIDAVNIISNEVSSEIAAEVDTALSEDRMWFRQPFTLDDPTLEN